MLASSVALCLFATAANAGPAQYSFTIWDWDQSYRHEQLFKRQVDKCAQYGVTQIELGVSWHDCEPAEGRYDFAVPDARVAYLLAKNLGIRLRINVADWPEWFHPELFQNPDGSPFDYRGGLPSVFNPENRARQLRFVSAAAEHFAGKGFVYSPGFSVHMEVKFGGWNTYEPSARAAFRAWLSGRYTAIDDLNAAWNASYASFGDIEPPLPRMTRGVPATDCGENDWIRFRELALADWVEAFAASVRKHDPSARISVPLGESFRSESAAFANLGYWDYSRPADEVVHSYDFFMHGARHVGDVALSTATVSGITQRPTVVEIDGPILFETYGYTPDQLVDAARIALDAGAVGVQVCNWGSSDLAPQSWMREIGTMVRARPNTSVKSPTALYYVSKWQNYVYREQNEDLYEQQFGLLRKLSAAKLPVRVVTDENLIHDNLRAEVLFAPSAQVMDAAARERLRAISLGTRVIAGEKPGVYTPEAKTDGNFGAKIEIVSDLRAMDAERIGSVLATPKEKPRTLRVAAVQFHTCFDIASNSRQIVDYINRAADAGARVAVFSEMALTGYTKKAEFRDTLDWKAIDKAIDEIKAACKARDAYAIVGAPTKDGDKIFCTALAIDPRGQIIDRFEKTYLAGEAWATPGRRLTTFSVDGVKCGSFVCHDERYPHLVQLRALAGAQLFFYISCESGVGEEHKIGPYRAQLQARAVENGVYIVHANAPALRDNPNAEGTSNGHSRIIGPDGNLVREAGAYEDAIVIADIDLRHARENGMPAALDNGPTAWWIRDGVELVDKE